MATWFTCDFLPLVPAKRLGPAVQKRINANPGFKINQTCRNALAYVAGGFVGGMVAGGGAARMMGTRESSPFFSRLGRSFSRLRWGHQTSTKPPVTRTRNAFFTTNFEIQFESNQSQNVRQKTKFTETATLSEKSDFKPDSNHELLQS